MESATFPLFVNVTLCAELEVPTSWGANVRKVDEKFPIAAVPVPDRATGGGSGELLSANRLRVPVRFPIFVGLNVTLRRQLAPGATELQQVELTPKSPVGNREKVNGAVPMFVSVTVCVLDEVTPTDPKSSDCGEKTPMAEVTPVPLRATGVIGTAGLVATESDPLREPAAVGVKVTLMVQLAAGASVAGQLLV